MSRLLPLLIVLSLLSSGCGGFKPSDGRQVLLEYKVAPGDTLYSIAWRYGYDYREVAGWNHIKAPYQIYVGQRLKIIEPFQRKVRTPPQRVASKPAAPVKKKPVTTVKPKPVVSPTSKPTPKRPSAGLEKPKPRTDTRTISWRWPVKGKVVKRYNPSAGRKGVDISGKRGQAILAAAPGVVVYSGEGLIGYGKLVIIKHNDTYLSAYGHNRRLLVKEGQRVKQGARIAELGGTRKEGAILHFEIRRDGKPIDPMRFLPGP